MRAYEEGIGTAEDIDTGARVGLNHPMGPLELADFIGLDVCLGIMRVLDDGLGGDHFRPPQVLVDLVAAGHLGQKTGRGFYTYPRPERPAGPAAGSTRRADRRGAAAPGDRPRVRRARGRADRDRARRGGALRPVAVHADGRARADRRRRSRVGRRGGLLATSAGRWSWRRSARPTWPRAVSLSVHILSQLPGRHLGNRRAAGALAAADARRRGAGRVRPDRAARRLRRRGAPDARRARRAGRRADRVPADGTKIWISNAPEAERYLVFATVDPDAGAKGITAFLVEKGTPGFRFGAHERKMGIRACPAAELVFDGAEVPVANRLGEEGEGYKIALSALGEGRISIARGVRRHRPAALEAAARYLQQRKAFGAPLAEQQGLRFMLAEMAREVAAARA